MIDPKDSEARRQRLEKARRMLGMDQPEIPKQFSIDLPMDPIDYVMDAMVGALNDGIDRRQLPEVTAAELFLVSQITMRQLLTEKGLDEEAQNEWFRGYVDKRMDS